MLCMVLPVKVRIIIGRSCIVFCKKCGGHAAIAASWAAGSGKATGLQMQVPAWGAAVAQKGTVHQLLGDVWCTTCM